MSAPLQLQAADIQERIDKIVHQLQHLKSDRNEDGIPIGIISMENWEWPQGVALFSLYLYYKESGKPELLDFLTSWFDRHLAAGTVPEKNINTMCPMLTLSFLVEETGRENYRELCLEWLDYAMNELPRTEEGGFQHIVSGRTNEGELWDDTLYMTVLFTARMGVLLGRGDCVQESVRQFLVHLKYLTDPVTGLFFHGWSFVDKSYYAGALWGRGNAWYTAGLVDYLDIVDLPFGVKQFLLGSLERQAKTLSALQADSGLWHTLLTDPTTYEETSATAAFAYGILKAVRLGYLPETYAAVGWKAAQGVMGNIDENGTVHGVSYGTGLGRDLDYYRGIPVCPMPYGQSMTLLMLVECLKHRS
ncbi:glycoside hydrolase family 88 protein [Paenibacillus sp.]|uniref:beta-galactosidase BglB n=1 Tax=Paenibacillus sp. TaxID=58172 RepID=UPI00281186A9|nr:glycoside hydrolase family 88 protein [Paenibacillus sp.]